MSPALRGNDHRVWRLTPWAALCLLGLLPSCGGSGLEGTIQPRYRSATGSLARYRVTVREVPAGRPGRTITARANLVVQSAEGGAHRVEARFTDLHFARETGGPVASDASPTLSLTLDERRRVQEGIETPQAEGVDALARVLQEGIVLPEEPVATGEPWELPPIERLLPNGETLSIPRTARVTGQDDEGIASIEAEGSAQVGPFGLDGATVNAEGRVEQQFRVRVADGALVDALTSTEVELTASLTEEIDIGRAIHRQRWRMQRLSDATGGPADHDWRPDVPGQECGASLDAMRRRFAQAPRNIDLDPLIPLDFEPPQRSDRRPIEEDSPLVIGTDRESLLASLSNVDLDRAVAFYVLAPRDLSDADLREIFELVPSTVQIRRLSTAQIVPPSPPRPAGIVRLRGRMRREGIEPWNETMRALVALCAQASTAYTEAMQAPPNERAARLRDGIVEAYGRCGCETTDLGRLERVIDLRVGAPQIGWAPLQEAPAEED